MENFITSLTEPLPWRLNRTSTKAAEVEAEMFESLMMTQQMNRARA